MYRISMHYYCIDKKAIINQILRREKRAIYDFEQEISLNNQIVRAFKGNDDLLIQQKPMDSLMETVIIKKWNYILSVYPLLCTKEQINNESWVKHDTRKSSIAQKYASLFVGQIENVTHLELWTAGELICDSNITRAGNSILTLVDLCDECYNIYNQWTNASPNKHCRFDELPIFLPEDWKEKWTSKTRSKYTIVCLK